jgi:hypothetical protein
VRRLSRILLNALTVLSLLLPLVTIVLWVRSYRTADQLWIAEFLVVSERGGVYVMPYVRSIDYPVHESFNASKLGMIEPEWSDEVRRTRPVRFFRNPDGFPAWLVIVADWFVVLAFAVMPGYVLARRLRRDRPGLCPSCGYDLRATPGRCGAVARIGLPVERVVPTRGSVT